jgi:hypothetical protein
VASINEVTNENVLVLREITSFAEELQHIEELSMDITADVHRCIHRLDIAFFSEEFLDFFADPTEITFREAVFALAEVLQVAVNI